MDGNFTGLPSGCVLLAEPKPSSVLDEETEEKIGDGDNDDEEEYDDFFSQPDTSKKSKNLYEEQLAKSTAVFFYHYVIELATGCIVPLVPYRPSSIDDEDKEFGSVESNRPSIDRFDDGLPFIGSKACASANRPVPLPPLSRDGPYSNPLNRGNGSLQWQRNSSASRCRPTKIYNPLKSSQSNTSLRVTASSKPQKSRKSIANFFLSNKNRVSANEQKTSDVFGGPTIDIGSLVNTGKTKMKPQQQSGIRNTSVPSARNSKLNELDPLSNDETSELSPIRLVKKKKKRNRLQHQEEATSSYFEKATEIGSSQLRRQSPLSPSKLTRNQMHKKRSEAQMALIKETPPVNESFDESDLDLGKLCDYFVEDPHGSENNSREILQCRHKDPDGSGNVRRVSKSPPADTRNRYFRDGSVIDLCDDDHDGVNAEVGQNNRLTKPSCSASRRPATGRNTLLAGFAIHRKRGASKRKETSVTVEQQKKRVK